jgi:7-carboxy-7-deazaguanine synthase
MHIAEVFRSLQGEGRLTGTESVFVRASGCNLRCAYCDTPYASWTPEGEDLSVAEIVARVEGFARPEGERSEPIRHVVLTGGEPMLFAEMIPLSETLREAGWHVTVETAGTLYLPVACDLMSISPKLTNSTPPEHGDGRWGRRHEAGRLVPEVIRRLVAEYDYQVKLVIDRPQDLVEVERFLAELPEIDRSRTMLMPQGTDPAELEQKARWIQPYCPEHGLLFCPRRQIQWYGPQRGV